jgi:4'-phosphopantetheinyl transferase EntD
MSGAKHSDFLVRSREEFLKRCADEGIDVDLARLEEGIGRGADRRKRESEAVRALAKAMLERRGVPVAEIPKHAEGFPIWPAGWVGSLSHSSGWCAAALAQTSVTRGVGVDVENPTRMKPAMWAHILTANERRGMEALGAEAAAVQATAGFSVKEALFKALSPLGGIVPGFLEVEIEWGGAGRFHAETPSDIVVGRCAVFDGVVLAVAWVTAK